MKVVGAIALLTAMSILTGCSNPRDVALPKNLGDAQALAALRPELDKLAPSEKELAGKFIIGQAMGAALAPAFGLATEPMPEGMTLGQAIEAQKVFEAQQATKAKRDAEEAALREAEKGKKRAQREAMIEEIRRVVGVSLAGIELRKADYRAGEFQSQILIKLSVENKGKKAIEGLKGLLIFKDKFSDVFYRSEMKSETVIAPGKTEVVTLGASYNQFMDKDVKLANSDADTITMAFIPSVVLFQDKSRVDVASDLE